MVMLSIEWILRLVVEGVAGTLGESKGIRWVVRLSLEISILFSILCSSDWGILLRLDISFARSSLYKSQVNRKCDSFSIVLRPMLVLHQSHILWSRGVL